MKLCKSNIFVNKILMSDFDRNLKSFDYDIIPSVDIKSVIVSNRPEIEITHPDNDNRIWINTFRFDSEKQFNLLATKAILTACTINNNIVRSLDEAKSFFSERKMVANYCLMSNDLMSNDRMSGKMLDNWLNLNIGKKIFDILGNGSYLRIFSVNGLKENQIIFTPTPEHFGVVAISGDDLDKYAIGIIDSAAPLLVELDY